MKNLLKHRPFLKGLKTDSLSKDLQIPLHLLYPRLIYGLNMNIKERKPVLEPVPGLFKKRQVQVVEAFKNKRPITVIAKRIFRLAHTVRTLSEAEKVKMHIAGLRTLVHIPNKRKRNSFLEKNREYLTVSISRMHDILAINLRRSIVKLKQLTILYSVSIQTNDAYAKKFPHMHAGFSFDWGSRLIVAQKLFELVSRRKLIDLTRTWIAEDADSLYGKGAMALAILARRFYFTQPVEQIKRELGIQTELIFEEEPALI